MRVERIDKVSPYQPAFDYLTKFYNRKAGRPKVPETELNEIDMTADSDDGAEEQAKLQSGGAEQKDEDPMELAAGLPGMSFCHGA